MRTISGSSRNRMKAMAQSKKINIQGSEISIISQKQEDFLSLTDMAKSQMQEAIIIKWLSLKSTIEYIGEWEALYNPDFNYTEFGIIKNTSGSNNFVLSVKQWIEHYHIHTDAIKENLIPAELTKQQINFVYASEADMLNMALFGKTALQWRNENPDAEGNIRDVATIEQLVVLSNMESINAVLIHQGLSQSERLVQLNKIAIKQMKSLVGNKNLKKLK